MTQTPLHKPTQSGILDRLKAGQGWLIKIDRDLHQMPDIGIGSKLEREYLEGLHLWGNLDDRLRNLYGFEGCVLGPGNKCNPESPVVCVDCADSGPVQLGLLES